MNSPKKSQKLHPNPDQLREKGRPISFSPFNHYPSSSEYNELLRQAEDSGRFVMELNNQSGSEHLYALVTRLFMVWLEDNYPDKCHWELFMDTQDRNDKATGEALHEIGEYYFWNKELWVIYQDVDGKKEYTMTFENWLQW